MTIAEIRDNRPQTFNLYLSIYRPNTVLSTRVNDPNIARGARTITIDASTVVTVANKTVYVGTAAGARDVGIIRAKSMDSTHLYVAENSHIKWVDRLYLTVVDYVDVQPIYPRIIKDPNDEEKTIFYKDYDIAYSAQNKDYGAFPCAGHHRAANIDPDLGYVDLFWTASGTVHVADASLSYDWEFSGVDSDPTHSGETPGYRRYSAPGYYVTKLTVTGSNGTVDTTYRYVSIHSPNNNPPARKWTIENLRGSRDEGGWTADLALYTSELSAGVYGGELVVIFSDDYLGPTKRFVDFGLTQEADGTKFVGYILKDSIRFSAKKDVIFFKVGTIHEVMKQSENFVISVEDKLSPMTWFQAQYMNGKKALYHYLRWHSTVLSVCDFRYVGKDYDLQFFDTDKSSMFDAIASFFSTTYVGQLTSNKLSQLWAETLPEADQIATSRPTELFALKDGDWIGEPAIELRTYNTLSVIELGGIAYLGPSYETSTPLLSSAPGVSPAYSGKGEAKTGLALISQEQLNWVSGHIYAKRNSPIQSALYQLKGFYGLDIAPLSSVVARVITEDTGISIDFQAKLLIEEIERAIDTKKGSIIDTVRFSQVLNGVPGETIPIVQEPDLTTPLNPTPYDPPFDYSIPLPAIPTIGDTYLIIHPIDKGIWWTNETSEASPRWWSMNYGLSGTTQLNYNFVDVGMDGSVWTLNQSELRNGPIGGTLNLLVDYRTIGVGDGDYPYPEYIWRLVGGMPSPFSNSEYILVVGVYYFGVALTKAYVYIVSKATQSYTRATSLTYSFDGDLAFITYGDGKFVTSGLRDFFGTVNFQQISKYLNDVPMTSDVWNVVASGKDKWHKRAGQTATVFTGEGKSTDFGMSGTWANFGNSSPVNKTYQDIDASPDGSRFMKIPGFDAIDFSPGPLLRSSDGGNFWGTTPNWPTGTYPDIITRGPICNMRTQDEWVIATKGDGSSFRKGYVFLTEDFGESWYDVTGNLRDFIGDYFIPHHIKVYR